MDKDRFSIIFDQLDEQVWSEQDTDAPYCQSDQHQIGGMARLRSENAPA